jgi:Phytanoyl-CoA dioxygenase (PhyH)
MPNYETLKAPSTGRFMSDLAHPVAERSLRRGANDQMTVGEPPVEETEIATLERDGFVVLKDILPPAEVEKARQDFERLYERDLAARREKGITEAHYPDGPAGYSILTRPSWLALDVMGKSEGFDRLLDQMLAHPKVRRVVTAWSGPNFRVGSVNIRYMTGEIDPPPAHELHRDGPFAMNLCVMLSDVDPGDNASTAFVWGSHHEPVNPRWDCLFEKPFRLSKSPARNGLSLFLDVNIFNRIYKAKMWKRLTGAFGKQGDIYFMGNGEVWHGRLPNMHGGRTMICVMGCVAATPEYAAQPVTVSTDLLAKLPSNLAKGLGGPFEINDPTNSIVDRLWKNRYPAAMRSLPYWARLERRLAEWISSVVLRV